MVFGTTMDTGSTVTNEPAGRPTDSEGSVTILYVRLVTGTVLLVSAGGAQAGLPYFTVWPPLLWERLFGPQCAGGVPSESSESTQQDFNSGLRSDVWRRHN